MSRDKTAVLRQTYTGEPYGAALEWWRRANLYNGLVPDAVTPAQQRLEAAVLRALARPMPLWRPAPPGTFYGLSGASPDLDRLLLRPARGQAAQVLARLLPAATADGLSGLAGLRARAGRRPGLSLAQLTGNAAITVTGVRADLRESAALQREAGAEPLWESNAPLDAREQAALGDLLAEMQPQEVELWSRALRRIGLFLAERPDWSGRAPTAQEVAGPRPEQIRPRPVGSFGPGGRVRGMVAIVSGTGRGGLGCTTSALALAAALARGGSSVAVLGLADDPNGLHTFLTKPPLAAGRWQQLTGDLPLMIGVLPTPAEPSVLAAAREKADVVLIDAGSWGRDRAVLDAADAVVALAPGSMPWTWHERVDSRPDWVRLQAWLDEQYANFSHLTPLQHLLTFLDLQFAWYVLDREGDGDPAVYDRHDPEEVEEWWQEALSDQRIDLDELEEVGQSVTDLDAQVDLAAWRQDFLTFLQAEGQTRHPELWPQAIQQWAEHATAAGKHDGAQAGHDGDRVGAFLRHVEDRAVQQWGERLWQDQHRLWAAAREAGDDLTQPYEHLLETRRHPLEPEAIAQEITRHLRDLPDRRTIVLLSRTTAQVSYHQLAEVRDVLHDDGITDLRMMPRLAALTTLVGDPVALTAPPAAARGAADHLARAVVDALRA